MQKESILETAQEKFAEIIENHELTDANIKIEVKTLSPEEAIGRPERRDYPIINGEEKVLEAEFKDARAHVFTDAPVDFRGNLQDIKQLPLNTNSNRAIFLGTLNAVLKKLNIIETTIHCRDEEPEECGRELAKKIRKELSRSRAGLIGFNPALAEALVNELGADKVHISDLDTKNIGEIKFGVKIMDGNRDTEELISNSDIIIFTGTTLVNNTFDAILNSIKNQQKNYLIFGVTASAICTLFNLNQFCLHGRI